MSLLVTVVRGATWEGDRLLPDPKFYTSFWADLSFYQRVLDVKF